MKKTRIPLEGLLADFKSQKVMNLTEIKNALNTQSTMTVFRKLKQISYFSSYSHRGRYYTLVDIPEFDEKGLWFYHSVRFSEHGTLLDTARVFVDLAEIGYSARELEEDLKVDVQESLLHLFNKSKISREKVTGVYIYFSADSAVKQRQFLLRQKVEYLPAEGLTLDVLNHELKAGIILFFSILDERQRRLYAGLEAFKYGHGGDGRIADLLGLDVHTVAKGRQELFNRDFETTRVRKKGGGRKSVKKKRLK